MCRGQGAGVQSLTPRGFMTALRGINRCHSRLGTKRRYRTKRYGGHGNGSAPKGTAHLSSGENITLHRFPVLRVGLSLRSQKGIRISGRYQGSVTCSGASIESAGALIKSIMCSLTNEVCIELITTSTLVWRRTSILQIAERCCPSFAALPACARAT